MAKKPKNFCVLMIITDFGFFQTMSFVDYICIFPHFFHNQTTGLKRHANGHFRRLSRLRWRRGDGVG